MVTATEIITHMDVIPRFAANPTISAIRSGNWNDPGVWSQGRVPQSGDRVAIGEQIAVVYNVQSDARIDALEISGSLTFVNNINTRLLVANLTVMPTGRLEIGSEAAPIQSGVQAEVIIADQALDLVNDPRQFGTGLIGFGEITIHGTAISNTWQRLAVEPTAGAQYPLAKRNADQLEVR